MANAKAAASFVVLLLLVAVLSAPLASAVGHRAPNGDFFFGMPRFGSGGFSGGWGAAAGGTWYRRGAVVPSPSTVCAQRGPCRGKRLTCPARCFKSYSYRSRNGGGGGGGGGCSFDCAHRCVASC